MQIQSFVYIPYEFLNRNVLHAFEMTLWAFPSAKLCTGPAPQFMHLYIIIRLSMICQVMVAIVGHHTERWCRASPYCYHGFF